MWPVKVFICLFIVEVVEGMMATAALVNVEIEGESRNQSSTVGYGIKSMATLDDGEMKTEANGIK